MWPLVIVGATLGSVYGLAGVGLVLTYKTSGIFNLAHGALGTVAAYVFYVLHVEHQLSWPMSAAISVLALGVLVGIAFESFGRSLSLASLVWRLGATIGILISIEALITIVFGSQSRTFPHFLPTDTFQFSGVYISYEQLVITLVSLSATAGLFLFFRLTRLGKSMRAVVDDPQLLDIAGTSPARVRRWAWIIGCTFAMLSGVLLAPSVNLDPTTLSLLIVQAFGAAAVGGFTSLPLTWLGGLGIGIAGSVVTQYGSSGSLIASLGPSLPFIVLFVVLFAAPKARLRAREGWLLRPRVAWTAPLRVQVAGCLTVTIFFLLVPTFAGYNLDQWTISLTDMLILVSLGILVRTAGQVSLCQISFAAIGATTFSKLAVTAGIPWLPSLLLAGLAAVPVGIIIAVPAVRLGGLYLALATLGFGLVLQDTFYSSSLMFGFGGVSLQVPAPYLSWLDVNSPEGFYYVVLAITVFIVIGVIALQRGRMGRLLRAVADSPRALGASGTTVSVTLVLVFCISAFIAAIAGALQGVVFTSVSGANFDPNTSLLFMAVVLLGVGGEPWYALLPALAMVLLPVYVSSGNVSDYLQLFFGVSAVQLAIKGQPRPAIISRIQGALDRLGGRGSSPALEQRGASPGLAGAQAGRQRGEAPVELEVREARVQFGGLVAVDEMSLRVRAGRITGLIGPNGAGKSTILNVCSGLTSPVSGSVLLSGRDVTKLDAPVRARLGLGRTFQQLDLFDSLNVSTNVSLGREASIAGRSVLAQFVSRRTEDRLIRNATAEAISVCGLDDIGDGQVGLLPNGRRRLVEFARCLAGPFDILMLDEPSAGLDRRETTEFGAILKRVVADRRVGILLVEHDMDLVMDVCDDIYVMNLGRLLFHGSPEEVRENEDVRRIYLGTSTDRRAGSTMAAEREPSDIDEFFKDL